MNVTISFFCRKNIDFLFIFWYDYYDRREEELFMEREDKRGVFFGVIGVLTLIVAIIGASFAYFSINASSKQDAVNVSAASVKIVYTEGDQIAIENLIPSTREIAMKTLTRGLAGTTHEVVWVYRFVISIIVPN